MPPGRTFSFESNDEQALASHEQARLNYQPAYSQQSYHDSPSRDIISPPPLYSSPPPLEPVSPIGSQHYRPSSQHSRAYSSDRVSSETRRRPLPSEYDEEPPPQPPPHRSSPSRGLQLDSQPLRGYRPSSVVTPGMDNFSNHSEGGGLPFVAQGVADRNQRESGLEALRPLQTGAPTQAYHLSDRDYQRGESPYANRPSLRFPERASYGSNIPLAAGAATPGSITPGASPDPRSSRYSARSIPLEDYPSSQGHPMAYSNYNDSPYHHSSHNFNPAVSEASINPNNIVDDGDDGFMPDPQRRSVMPMHRQRSNEPVNNMAAGGAAGAGGVLGGLFGRKAKNQTSSGAYDPVRAGQDGAGKTGGEKSEWLSRQTKGTNKMRWTVGVVIGLVVVIAIVAGIIGGVLGSHNSNSGSSSSGNTNNAADDTAANGDLGKDSSEIQALMNNKDLHKVFPGMDYTPWGTQYPLCMTYPPSQNNVTRDMAVLSQLTNNVRLYGTDCNQTEMVLHAIDRLELIDMKVWLGVWIDTNQTTTDRQLNQMYDILQKTKDLSIFKGAIIGNEALYRAGEDKSQSEQELITILTDVRSQFSAKGYDVPIATSDLGDNWNGQLVTVVDIVMSNIHPFFAGTTADIAAGWTWDFWQSHDVVLTQGQPKIEQIISETGWPSEGGKDCGGTTGDCTTGQSGAIASVDNMNLYMENWVCQALANGTEYFWFEAFDEPWKIVFNEPGKEWEDKWGLLDSARNLKDGLKIPDCGGKTIGS